jgi:hypothetical protein
MSVLAWLPEFYSNKVTQVRDMTIKSTKTAATRIETAPPHCSNVRLLAAEMVLQAHTLAETESAVSISAHLVGQECKSSAARC